MSVGQAGWVPMISLLLVWLLNCVVAPLSPKQIIVVASYEIKNISSLATGRMMLYQLAKSSGRFFFLVVCLDHDIKKLISCL
jgi:hypothetical protein